MGALISGTKIIDCIFYQSIYKVKGACNNTIDQIFKNLKFQTLTHSAFDF